MDNYRALVAVALSLAILLGYQYFFVPPVVPPQPPAPAVDSTSAGTAAPAAAPSTQPAPSAPAVPPSAPAASPQMTAPAPLAPPAANGPKGRLISVETDLYTAVFSENGAALKSMVLRKHKESIKKDSPGKELVMAAENQGYPLKFSWGTLVGQDLLYTAGEQQLDLRGSAGDGVLSMVADAGNGMTVERRYTFHPGSYLFDLQVVIRNGGGQPLQGVPQLYQVNPPFEEGGSPADGFLFQGPSAFMNNERHEVKADTFANGPVTLQGKIEWAGFEGNYFLRAIIPQGDDGGAFTMQGNDKLTYTMMAGNLDTILPGEEKNYAYKIFYGPKNIRELRQIGYNLERSVNFGWFDVIARPTLWLLNLFYGVVRNYGIAIILVTVLFKAIFWPISQKGLKSMKNMQKLQPKMAKIKEKYKGDPAKMNQEVMNLYKTYKVNPFGGCLPMLLQIPVFFALYKVLLQSIELRHAPFMLWINDLAAPDRLWLGFDIPYLGGLPVLTLLMGASMWYQQKLSPTTADPMQAKIMMMLPVLFTFMFINFASGLVLYWFVNNLLSILQQKLINRDSQKKEENFIEMKSQA